MKRRKTPAEAMRGVFKDPTSAEHLNELLLLVTDEPHRLYRELRKLGQQISRERDQDTVLRLAAEGAWLVVAEAAERAAEARGRPKPATWREGYHAVEALGAPAGGPSHARSFINLYSRLHESAFYRATCVDEADVRNEIRKAQALVDAIDSGISRLAESVGLGASDE